MLQGQSGTRDRPRELGEYVGIYHRFAHERPEKLPTLSDFVAKEEADNEILDLLARERRRVRKLDELLDKFTDAFEEEQFEVTGTLDVQVMDTSIEIWGIRQNLSSRFLVERKP
ncbi:MAG: hypothetical protein ACYTEL_16985 [Planctomycetota bacterium]|jgi:hypothetical protein